MTEPYYKYLIRSGWKGRAEAPSDIGARFVDTLTALRDVDAIFANWSIFDTHNLVSFPASEARSRIAAVVEDNVARDDYDEPSPVYGYHISAMTSTYKDPRRQDHRSNRHGQCHGPQTHLSGVPSERPVHVASRSVEMANPRATGTFDPFSH